MRLFPGLHQPADCSRLWAAGAPCMVSVNRLHGRRGGFGVGDWVMDSGAFTSVALKGGYDHEPAEYAAQIRRWRGCGRMLWAAAQDFMCEPFVLAKTGCTVAQHQQLTVDRYDALTACDTGGVTVLPVLQGYWPDDYRRHVEQYGDRLRPGMRVGVGSVCKRNGSAREVACVLRAIARERPDLRLHGFGLKRTALADGEVRGLLASADSMAWSYSARKQGRNGNDWREARQFWREVQAWEEPEMALFARAA